MPCISLHLTVASADVLKPHTTFFTRPRFYAAVSLIGGGIAASTQRTHIDEHGGAKPVWGFPMKFEVKESNLRQNNTMLVFQLRRPRAIAIGDKDIGLLYVPVMEIFDYAGGRRNWPRPVAYPVSSRSGKPKGVLYLSYLFSETTSPERGGGGGGSVGGMNEGGVGGCVRGFPGPPAQPRRRISRWSGRAPLPLCSSRSVSQAMVKTCRTDLPMPKVLVNDTTHGTVEIMKIFMEIPYKSKH